MAPAAPAGGAGVTSDDLIGTARRRVKEAIAVLEHVEQHLGPEAGAVADLRIDALRAVIHALTRDLVQLRGAHS